MDDALINMHLGQYHIIELIRHGGMSTVYKAYQDSLDRYVAVKVLPQDRDPEFAARFKREARALAQLQHPNILPIYDYNEQNGILYLVMQYVDDGRTLGDLLGSRLAPAAALRLTVRLLDALEYAHSRGIIHRDIKPSNVLMPDPNWPMLADFGIVRLLNDTQQRLTIGNQIIGTAAYMAPEQATGKPVDARTDLYATGVLLYEMLTGRVPFDADTPMGMLAKHAYEAPPPPRSLNPELSPEAEAVLLRALMKDSAARYQSAREMADALQHLATQLDQRQSRSQAKSLYQVGLQAFEQGHWDEAVERFSRLVALDPGFEDAADLLTVAQASQERARSEARQQIEQVRLRRQSTIQQGPRSTTPTPTSLESGQLLEPTVALAPRRAVPWAPFVGIAAVIVLVLLALMWLRQPARPTPVVIDVTAAPSNAQPTIDSLARATSIPQLTAMETSAPASGAAPTAPASMSMGGATSTSSDAPTAAAANGHNMEDRPTAVSGSQEGGMDTLPTPVGTLVYKDDFNADTASETAKTGLEDVEGDAEFNPGFHPGVYRMDLTKSNDTRTILLPRLAYSDFSMRMDLWDDSDTPSGDVAQGVVFRAQDDTHFYTVLVDPRTGQYAIRKRLDADRWTDLVAWKASPIVKQKTDVNYLRVDTSGASFTIYLNGQMLEQITDADSPYVFGMLGMIVANVDAINPLMHFDNLTIWSNDPADNAPVLDPKRDMIRVPAGAFILGSYLFGNQKPQIVSLPDFLIDRTEVTNAAYKECVAAGKCEPQSPASDTHPNYASDPSYANFPATHISWRQARTYCTWAGKRLPTEAEWEKASSWNAVTHEKLDWPWGNSFDKTRLNSVESNRGDTTAIGTFSPELNGTVDMAGNISEWTSSLFKSYPYDPSDGREDLQAPGDRVYRGGSYLQTKGKARGFFRRNAPPTDVNREIGFRCAATQ